MTPPPLPPANPDEHQYWTDPILREETRSRLEHFRNLRWLPPNYKPKTLEGLAVNNGTGEGTSSLHSHGGPEDVSIKTNGLQILCTFERGLRGISTLRR